MKTKLLTLVLLVVTSNGYAANIYDAINGLEGSFCAFIEKTQADLARDKADYAKDPSDKNKQWLSASEHVLAYNNSGCDLAHGMRTFLSGGSVDGATLCTNLYQASAGLLNVIPTFTVFDSDQISALTTMATEGLGLHTNLCIGVGASENQIRSHWRKLANQ